MYVSFSKCILWLRNDLRISDNLALAEADRLEGEVIPLYIWSPEEFGEWAPGGASRWWLSNALKGLDAQLKSLGGRLFIREGESLSVLREIASATGASHVFWNRRYESALRERDARIKKVLSAEGYEVRSFNSSLLNEPHTVASGSGSPYKVYTPYFKMVKDRPIAEPIEPPGENLLLCTAELPGNEISAQEICPKHPWTQKFEAIWDVSEDGAKRALEVFLNSRVRAYDTDRDIPSVTGTSELSPYLHYGLIGPRQVVARLKDRADTKEAGAFTFFKEIYWREFAYNVLYHFPHTQDKPLQPKYAYFPWSDDSSSLAAWKRGQTGYPIVDAGMRQLWATGWMHNRVRMIVSSFLVKHLLQDWKQGALWFWDTLVDADLASNSLGWQWSGGCGADAAPYFRIFNPMTQGKRFDPDGDYVKKWIPELSKLPSKYIHEPWLAPEGLLVGLGIKLGENYPEPVVDHDFGRKRALAALDQLKELAP